MKTGLANGKKIPRITRDFLQILPNSEKRQGISIQENGIYPFGLVSPKKLTLRAGKIRESGQDRKMIFHMPRVRLRFTSDPLRIYPIAIRRFTGYPGGDIYKKT